MRRSTFKRKSYEEVIASQRAKIDRRRIEGNIPKLRNSRLQAKSGLKKGKKRKIATVTSLKKKLDAIFSKFIRQKYADSNGNCRCYTCGYTAHWKKLQNGHMVSRYYLATRYDERNCRPQCYTCNMFRNGMIPDFSKRLEEELGEGITKTLYEEARKISIDFPYQEKIDYYKTLIKE